MWQVECDGAPGGWGQPVDVGEQALGASAQGHEGDPGGVEPVEPLVGGELGIENEMLRDAAVLALPEVDEAEHLISFLTLPDVGVRVAEHMAVGFVLALAWGCRLRKELLRVC